MTPQEKAKSLMPFYWQEECKDKEIALFDCLMTMHEWTKEKALKAFCYANCTELMKKRCECEKTCKEFLIFKREMEK